MIPKKGTIIVNYYNDSDSKCKVEMLLLIVKFNTVWYCLHLTRPLEIRVSSTFLHFTSSYALYNYYVTNKETLKPWFQYNPYYFLYTFSFCFMFHDPGALVLFWCCPLHAVVHTAGSPDQDGWWRSSAPLCQWVSSLYFPCLCLQAVSTRPRACLPSPHTLKQQKGRSSGSCLINNPVKNN